MLHLINRNFSLSNYLSVNYLFPYSKKKLKNKFQLNSFKLLIEIENLTKFNNYIQFIIILNGRYKEKVLKRCLRNKGP